MEKEGWEGEGGGGARGGRGGGEGGEGGEGEDKVTKKGEDEVRKEVDPAGSFPEAFRIGSLRGPVHIPAPFACVSLDRLDLHVNYNGFVLSGNVSPRDQFGGINKLELTIA